MNRRIPSLARAAWTLGLVCCVAGCVTKEWSRDRVDKTDPWIEPTLVMRQQIHDQAARLPWTHGVERVEAISWFASVGEPAYSTLLNLAEDRNPRVSGSALAALGATGDHRLVPFVQALDSSSSIQEDPMLELEHARTLMRLGDWSRADALIRGLSSAEPGIRALCIQTLRSSTGLDLGFEPRGEELERRRAVERWQEWWQRRAGDEILASGIDPTDPRARRGSER